MFSVRCTFQPVLTCCTSLADANLRHASHDMLSVVLAIDTTLPCQQAEAALG